MTLNDFYKLGASEAVKAALPHMSDIGHDLIEVGGLGLIAAPYVRDAAQGKKDETGARNYELAGLGTLAAPSVKNLGTHAVNFLRGR